MDTQFAFQFPVNSNGIYNISIEDNILFKKSEYTTLKRMQMPLIIKRPSEHYQKIIDDFTNPVLDALIKLKQTIEKFSNDKYIEAFVPIAIDMCIKSITYINRVKMERMMIIIKVGINSNVEYEIMEAFVELEYITKLFFPEDRNYFPQDEALKLRKSIIDMTIVNSESVIKLLEDINLESSITKNIREILMKIIISDRSKLMKIILDYLTNVNRTESVVNSTVSVTETFDMMNTKQKTDNEDVKMIEFSTLTIAIIIRDNEMYIDYFGFIDKPVGGSFSLDFLRFRNFINGNITYYIFYLVTCHYCMTNKDNILGVNFGIIPSEIFHMFIFFEAVHMNKVLESIEGIPTNISYKKIFSHLNKFFYNIMGRKKPELKIISNIVRSEEPKKVGSIQSERLTMIKNNNSVKKNGR